MSEIADAVRVDIYSDYTCPWCFIGWARFERARALLPPDVRVHATWHPLEIHPEVPSEGMPFDRLGYPADRWEAMQKALHQAAVEEGLDVSGRPFVANTRRALMAGAYAQAEQSGRFDGFHERLFAGYFTDGRDLGAPAVIDEIAAEASLDVEAMRVALDSGRYEEVLSETGRRAASLGISSTPTFVLDGRYGAVGAQPAEALAMTIERVARQGDET